jgi:tetratricopeptide (TPR) repeat protein
MHLKILLLLPFLLALGGLFPLANPGTHLQQVADTNTSPSQSNFGRVDMELSCSPPAEAFFQEGIALIHSFWWDEARKRFQAAAETDPECALAYWGVAMTYNDGLHAPPSEEEIRKAQHAVEKAHAANPPTAREQAYVRAVELLYQGYPELDRPGRDLLYSQAMERIYRTYSQDFDGKAFYALSLLALGRRSGSKGYELQMKAAEILEPMFSLLESHPGIAHYLIHAYDDSGHRDRGLAAARRYSKIAAAVPHALHMPSHIFAGLGMWDETIASNQASFQASEDEVRHKNLPLFRRSYHALSYWVYALLQKGQFGTALALVDEHRSLLLASKDSRALRYLHDMEVRLRLEIRDWKDAAAIQAVLNQPFQAAEVLYVRGLGLARTGNTESAKGTLEKLDSLLQQLTAMKDPAVAVQKQIVSIQAKQLAAAILMARNEGEKAVLLMREACQIEDALAVSQFPPDAGTGLPSHEFFGEILLELGKPEEARREFRLALQKTPGRLHSLSGLAKATALSGHSAKAKLHYEVLLDLSAQSDSELPQLQEAHHYLASFR